MHIASFKPAVFMLSILALAACGDPGPRTHDSKGRAMATTAMATTVFMNVCFNTGANRKGELRAINKDKNIVLTSKPDESFLFASHKTHSIDITIMSEVCSVSFDTGETSTKAGSDAALLLLPKVGAKSMGGSPGGGQLNLKTRKGTVVVANGEKAKRFGAILYLYTY